MSPAEGPTPGRDRLLRFEVNGHEFLFRRPSRADVKRARLLYATAVGAATQPYHYDVVDGVDAEWESRLQVGLQPRILNGARVSLGESAPEHWFQPVYDADGKPLDRVFSVEEVSAEEFRAVCDRLAELLAADEKKSPTVSSTSGATPPSSG